MQRDARAPAAAVASIKFRGFQGAHEPGFMFWLAEY